MTNRDLRDLERPGDSVEKDAPRRTWRDRLYGKIKVSVNTMNLIIYALIGLLAVTLLLGALTAGR